MIDDKTLFVHLLVINVFVLYSARTWNTLNLWTIIFIQCFQYEVLFLKCVTIKTVTAYICW
jgi:hypothetical protein